METTSSTVVPYRFPLYSPYSKYLYRRTAAATDYDMVHQFAIQFQFRFRLFIKASSATNRACKEVDGKAGYMCNTTFLNSNINGVFYNAFTGSFLSPKLKLLFGLNRNCSRDQLIDHLLTYLLTYYTYLLTYLLTYLKTCIMNISEFSSRKMYKVDGIN